MEPLLVLSSKHARCRAAKAARAVSTPHGGQYEHCSDDRGGSSKTPNECNDDRGESSDDRGGSSKYPNETIEDHAYDILRARKT